MSRDRSQMQYTRRFQRMGSADDSHLFLFWLTCKYTYTPEETLCHSPVACCVTVIFALPNPTGTGKDGINHNCHLPYMRNREIRETGPPKMNFDWSAGFNMEVMFVVFLFFFGRICFALAASSRWYCSHDSDVKADCPHTQSWVSHSVVCLWNPISAWNVTFLVAVHFDVIRWAVVSSFRLRNKCGLCAINLVDLFCRWLLKTVINFNCDDKIVNTLKISPQCNFLTLLTHLSFILTLEGGVYKIEAV